MWTVIDPPSPQKERAAQTPGTRGTDSEKRMSARKSPWRGGWHPLQRSCLENPVDRGAGGLQSVCGVARGRTRLSHPQNENLRSVETSVLLGWVMLANLGFPGSSAGKESTCNAGDPSSTPGSGKPAVEGKGYPLQYSGLENSMDCTVLGVTKSRTRLSPFTLTSLHGYSSGTSSSHP